MPLQNLWFSFVLSADIKGFKTSVLRPFLWAYHTLPRIYERVCLRKTYTDKSPDT